MPNYRTDFKGFVKLLKSKFPLEEKIYVRRTVMPFDNDIPKERLYGDCTLKDGAFYIRINKDLSLGDQKETLIHEWAHCLAGWSDDADSHSDEWGIQYATIYRAMV